VTGGAPLKRVSVSCLALLVISAGAAQAQGPSRDPLTSLAWLAGDWFGNEGAVRMEELWTDARGGMMLGVHRDVKDGRAVSFEFFRIESTPDGIVYFASPGGRPAVPFLAAEIAGKRVVFENKAHDFPKRIIYWLADDGSLHARVEGNPGDKERSMEWTWRKGRPE